MANLKFESEVAEDGEDDEPGQEGGQGVRNAKHQYTINCGTMMSTSSLTPLFDFQFICMWPFSWTFLVYNQKVLFGSFFIPFHFA